VVIVRDSPAKGRIIGVFSSNTERLGRRVPPPDLVAQAAAAPGGWMYEIDRAWVDDPDGYVPPEAIRGAWKVSDDGRLTGEYRENDQHRPPHNDFSALGEADHWLGWLGDEPPATLLTEIGNILNGQFPGTAVEWIKVLDRPRCVTAGRRRPLPSDPERIQVTRAGVALPFAVMARPPERARSLLLGVFSWVATKLDRPGERRDQVWFELGADLDQAEQALRNRIYEPDQDW
jgi:hypothetical protein